MKLVTRHHDQGTPADPGWRAEWRLSRSMLSRVVLQPVPAKYYQGPNHRCAMLSDLNVEPHLRGKAFAHKLVSAAVSYADRHGLDLWLYARPFGTNKIPLDRLADLYRFYGFRLRPADKCNHEMEMVRKCRLI